MLDRSGRSQDGLSEERMQRRERQKLIVRTKAGDVYYGMCFALNKNAAGFHLDLQDKNGRPKNRTRHIPFDTLKAVYYVRSFDGRFNPEERHEMVVSRQESVAVIFEDEDVLRGRPMHASWHEEPRFFVIPEEQDSNNVMVLVERSAVKSIQDLDQYKKQRHAEFSAYVKKHRRPGMHSDECAGDFYFSKHDYKNALRHYRVAREAEGLTDSLKQKLCAAQYNLSLRYIKQKDYAKSLQLMELVLRIDPSHEKAMHKSEQLRAHIARKRSGEGSESDPDFDSHGHGPLR